MSDPDCRTAAPAPAADEAALDAHLEHLFRHAGEHPAAHDLRQIIRAYRLAQRQAAVGKESRDA